MSRAAGKKINRIITFSKKKPPLPGEPSSAPGLQDNPLRCGEDRDGSRDAASFTISFTARVTAESHTVVGPPPPRPPSTGYLSVCVGGSWKERWCVVRAGSLHLHKEPGEQRSPVGVVPLRGTEVVPGGLGPRHPFSFCIRQAGTELAALEVTLRMDPVWWCRDGAEPRLTVCVCVCGQASCSEDLGRWLGVLFAESGSPALPEELHYDYIDVDTLTDIRHAARHSFLSVTSCSGCFQSLSSFDF